MGRRNGNTYIRALSEEQAKHLQQLRAEGVTLKVLAHKFQVSRRTIGRYLKDVPAVLVPEPAPHRQCRYQFAITMMDFQVVEVEEPRIPIQHHHLEQVANILMNIATWCQDTHDETIIVRPPRWMEPPGDA